MPQSPPLIAPINIGSPSFMLPTHSLRAGVPGQLQLFASG